MHTAQQVHRTAGTLFTINTEQQVYTVHCNQFN